MRFLLRFVILLFAGIGIAIAVNAQSTSSKGTEFYTAFIDHVYPAGALGTNNGSSSYMKLYITSDVSTSGIVELMDGSFNYPYNVVANQVTIIQIPPNAFLGDVTGTFAGKGVHITAQRPVAVYAHIYGSSVSGATLLLPVSTLGKNYTSLNYTQISNSLNSDHKPSYSIFMVVATADSTTIQYNPTSLLTDNAPLGIQTITLAHKGDVFQGISANDLTGTTIKSISANGVACKKIAVFSGSSKIYISGCAPNLTSPVQTSDNLFQQVYPTSTWGKNYITAPLANRSFDIFRIVVSDPTTQVTKNGVAIPASSFTSSGYYEYTSTTSDVISADKPIQVIQYAVTQNAAPNCTSKTGDVGDPEMIYLNPIEQGVSHVTLYSAGTFKILRSYVNVIIPTAAISSLTLDGQAVTTIATPVPDNPTYSYLQIPVSTGLQAGATGADNGTHNLSASQPFNAIAYGFGDKESYGYSAGTDLKNLTEFVDVKNSSSSTVIQTSGCSNIQYTPQVTIPFKVSQITWKFDGDTTVVQNNPSEKDTVINGQTLYGYSYYDAVKKTASVIFSRGSHSVVATVFNPSADQCGNNDNIEFDFDVINPPSVTFNYSNLCLGQGTTFNYTPTDTLTNKFDWDFGDGTVHSTTQNPVHTYATSGNYQVVLAVTGPTGCSSVSAPQTVHISKKPVAAFSRSTPDCETGSIDFKDASTDPEGNKVIARGWDFGDGGTATTQNPAHTYTTAGTYKVKLVVTNDKGCQGDTTTQNLVVHPTPVANFTAPDVCLQDGQEQFTNTSDFRGDLQAGFTYNWTFGDATSASNSSNLSNPTHSYSKAGTYIVTLFITSPYGCTSAVTSKQIIVNASNPAAAFAVLNPTGLCASSPVVFQDKTTKSTNDVITKVVWHWGDGTADSTYDKTTIHSDGLYNHAYPFKSSVPATKTFTVTLNEYTGLTCVSSVSQSITVNANPLVAITKDTALCQEASSFTIAQKTAFKGNGVFSGTGVTAKGVFDPYKAGPGIFTINYLFTANNTGCTYTDSVHITVYPTPVIILGPDFKLLEGDTTKLVATAVGDSLTYQWYPSAGLNHDNILNPVASPTDDTKYTLTATSAKGCSASASVFVTVLKLPKVPNTFTPNGDGVNDFWVIDQLNKYVNATVDVYNRNGEKVYSTIGYSIPWDGKFKGADLPVGVYYYIINPKEGRKTMSGFVTIIR